MPFTGEKYNEGPTKANMKIRCSIDQEKGCWVWTKAASHDGRDASYTYGVVKYQGRMRRASHVALILWRGVHLTPDQGVVMTCGNSLCINPEHAQLISMSEMIRKLSGRRDYAKQLAEREDKRSPSKMHPRRRRKANS